MSRAPVLAVAAAALLAAGCELTETTTVDPVVVPVLEMVLRASAEQQTAYLHRAGPAGPDRAVSGARVAVLPRDRSEERLLFDEAELPFCVVFWRQSFEHADGTCYISAPAAVTWAPVAGGTYRLEAALPDGGRLTGVTTLPAAFEVLRPSLGSDTCALAPDTPLELLWTRSSGAWAYVVEANLYGLDDALAGQGIEVADDPFFLRGVSVSERDTALVLPGELGLLDAAELERELVLSLQRGLPAGVVAEVTVAAVDRNFVNWARGGSFHPSGQVRVSSVRGAGLGLFGSAVERTRVIRVGEALELPSCAP